MGLILLLLVIVLYVSEIVPLAVTAVGGCLLMVWFQVVGWSTAFSGFSNDVTWLAMGMIIVGAAFFETGLADTIGTAIIKKVGTSENKLIVFLYPCVMFISSVTSNTGTTAAFTPITQAIARKSGGKISSRRMLMPVAWAATTGGMLTMISSTPQIFITGLMEKTEGLTPFGFFEYAYIGLPICIALVIYCLTIGKKMTKAMGWKDEEVDEVSSKPKNYSKTKMTIVALILAFCVTGTILQRTILSEYITLGTVAVTGALLTVVLGCMSIKRLYEVTDWNIFFILAGSIGFAAALNECGTGQLIADKAVGLFSSFGNFAVYAVLVLISIILTQMISNTACIAIMAPIGLFVAQGMGFNPMTVLMGMASGCAASYMTPISTPPNMVVLSAGNYSFMDYVKFGVIFQIIAATIIIFLCPVFWPL
jgi:anion transporter